MVNVKDKGARGDGRTDDAGDIAQAVADLPARGGVLYFPAGEYLTTEPLVIDKPCTAVRGDGIGRSIFRAWGALQQTAITFAHPTGAPLPGCSIEQIEIRGDPDHTRTALFMRKCHGPYGGNYLAHVRAWSAADCQIRLDNCWSIKLHDVAVGGRVAGAGFGLTGVEIINANAARVDGLAVRSLAYDSVGLRLTGADAAVVTGGSFEGVDTAIQADGQGITILGPYCESTGRQQATCFRLGIGAAAKNVEIAGARIWWSGADGSILLETDQADLIQIRNTGAALGANRRLHLPTAKTGRVNIAADSTP